MKGGFELKNDKSDFPYWTGWKDAEKTEIGGYIFIARGSGYSSVIESMVGVGPDGAIVSVIIMSQQETPGLGAKVQEVRHGESSPFFPQRFEGKTAHDNIKVEQDGGKIESITGATISSRTVGRTEPFVSQHMRRIRSGLFRRAVRETSSAWPACGPGSPPK